MNTIHKFITALFVFAALSTCLYADIDVNNLFADIKVKYPDNTEKRFTAGQKADNLPDGAQITLLAGSMDISLGKGSFATLKAGPLNCPLTGGDFVSISFAPTSKRIDIQAFSGTPQATNTQNAKKFVLTAKNLTIE